MLEILLGLNLKTGGSVCLDVQKAINPEQTRTFPLELKQKAKVSGFVPFIDTDTFGSQAAANVHQELNGFQVHSDTFLQLLRPTAFSSASRPSQSPGSHNDLDLSLHDVSC